jgi:uncharacterized ferritin-like protein (DUF455 family)
MVLETKNIWKKIEVIESSVHEAMAGRLLAVPQEPARDIAVFEAGKLPPKKGLSFVEGQARLLHDLASIELQAMELGLRTLIEYQEAPVGFREELAKITLDEARHLKLCLQAMEGLGFSWGAWPAHLALWNSVDASDSLLDRVLIVHRYLEGSGLDAGDTFLRKLDGVSTGTIHQVVKVISTEEIRHVEFGSRWYREICRGEGIDPQQDFVPRLEKLRYRIPKRIEKVSRKLRLQAGFTEAEIEYLERLRESIVKYPVKDLAQSI